MHGRMKVAVITCYSDPDNPRVQLLRAALKSLDGVRPLIIKNKHKGLLRYPEVIWKTWRLSRNKQPDMYLLTFRGQELLPFMLWLAGKRPLFFDEFVVPLAYADSDVHGSSFPGRLKQRLARSSFPLYRRWLHRCAAILADTTEQAELSARIARMNLSMYVAIPVPDEDFSDVTINATARLLRPLLDAATS